MEQLEKWWSRTGKFPYPARRRMEIYHPKNSILSLNIVETSSFFLPIVGSIEFI